MRIEEERGKCKKREGGEKKEKEEKKVEGIRNGARRLKEWMMELLLYS